jgi:hypothetical protein
MELTAMSATNVVRPCAMIFAGTHTPCQSGLVDNAKSRVLQWGSLSELMADCIWRIAGKNGSEELTAYGRERMRGQASALAIGHTPQALVTRAIHGGFYGYDGTCGADRDSDLDRA